MFGMGVLGKVFGTEKALGALVKAGRDGLDKLYYTTEEKAEDKAKHREKARDQVVEFMRATQGQNVARRLIALIIISIWSVSYVLAMILNVTAVFNAGHAANLKEAAELIGAAISDVEAIMYMVIAFYFGAPHVEGVLKVMTDRKLKKDA